MEIQVLNDSSTKTEPGKSTRKGVTVLIQGATVVALLQLALSHFDVPNKELWLSLATPALIAVWHTLQKFILHKLGIKIEFEVPLKNLLPVLLIGCTLTFVGCATILQTSKNPEENYRTMGVAFGQAGIENLQSDYYVEVTENGSITQIGQKTDGIAAEGGDLIGSVVSSVVRGMREAEPATTTPPAPRVTIPSPKPQLSLNSKWNSPEKLLTRKPNGDVVLHGFLLPANYPLTATVDEYGNVTIHGLVVVGGEK